MSIAKSVGNRIYQIYETFCEFFFVEDEELLQKKFQRRVESGYFGVSIYTLLPRVMTPKTFLQEQALTEVSSTLKDMSHSSMSINTEELLKSSFNGLLDIKTDNVLQRQVSKDSISIGKFIESVLKFDSNTDTFDEDDLDYLQKHKNLITGEIVYGKPSNAEEDDGIFKNCESETGLGSIRGESLAELWEDDDPSTESETVWYDPQESVSVVTEIRDDIDSPAVWYDLCDEECMTRSPNDDDWFGSIQLHEDRWYDPVEDIESLTPNRNPEHRHKIKTLGPRIVNVKPSLMMKGTHSLPERGRKDETADETVAGGMLRYISSLVPFALSQKFTTTDNKSGNASQDKTCDNATKRFESDQVSIKRSIANSNKGHQSNRKSVESKINNASNSLPDTQNTNISGQHKNDNASTMGNKSKKMSIEENESCKVSIVENKSGNASHEANEDNESDNETLIDNTFNHSTVTRNPGYFETEGTTHWKSTSWMQYRRKSVEFVVDGKSYRKAEGYRHYKKFSAVENSLKVDKLVAMRNSILVDCVWRQNMIDEIVRVAKEYYDNPMGAARKKWKKLRGEINQGKEHSVTDARVKLSAAKYYFPTFSNIMMLIQMLFLGFMMLKNGILPQFIISDRRTQNRTITFLGIESVNAWSQTNMWIGVHPKIRMEYGSMVSSCMRDDFRLYQLRMKRARYKNQELGCCEVAVRNTAGTTLEKDCEKLTLGVGKWRKGIPCGQRSVANDKVLHLIRPCCVPLSAECIFVSFEHCQLIEGTFITDSREHCSQINCANITCKFGGTSPDPKRPWMSSSYQFWRIFVALIDSHGMLHLLFVLCGEWILLVQLEQSIGWFRVLILYSLSGTAGVMCASLFSPYTPQVGTSAAVMGCLGAIFMELYEAKKYLSRPLLQFFRLASIVIFATILGTLPNVSLAAIVTGFVVGHISACILCPYIRPYRTRGNIFLVVGAIGLLIIIYFLIFYFFYNIQTVFLCSWCRKLECFDYFNNMCVNDK